MPKFQNRTNYIAITNAVKAADKLFDPFSPMMRELQHKNDWGYDSGSGNEVRQRLMGGDIIGIYTYRPWNPFTKAIGYFDGTNIHINIYKLPKLTHKELVGLLLHEGAHGAGFNHGTGPFRNYKTKHKCLYSVNYYMSENVGKWL